MNNPGAYVLAMGPWTISAIVAISIGLAAALYNNLTHKQLRCQETWRQILVLLHRRNDLIAVLLARFKTAGHVPPPILDELVKAHAAALTAGPVEQHAQAQSQLTRTLQQALAMPTARDKEIEEIKEEMISTDNRLAFARRQYNEFAADYNRTLRGFPGSLIARLKHLEEQPAFEEPEAAKDQIS